MYNLMFRNTVLETISHNGQIWFTSAELAKALEYSRADSVTRIYDRNRDEFTSRMTETVNLAVSRESKTYDNLSNKIRIFSLRGAHLIAMLSNTPIAKEFRKWVLDILDSEVGQPVHQPEARELLTDHDTSNLARLIWSMVNGFRFEKKWTQGIWYALRHATGVSSPQDFEVNQIPILAEECSRIYNFTNALKAAIFEAEKQAVRRVLRQREDADAVLSEMKQLLDASNKESSLLLNSTLTLWQQDGIQKFLQRH